MCRPAPEAGSGQRYSPKRQRYRPFVWHVEDELIPPPLAGKRDPDLGARCIEIQDVGRLPEVLSERPIEGNVGPTLLRASSAIRIDWSTELFPALLRPVSTVSARASSETEENALKLVSESSSSTECTFNEFSST